MSIPIPTAAAVRSAAKMTRQPSVMHPVMLGFAVDSHVDLSTPTSLLGECVEVRPLINPVIDELALRANLKRSGPRSFKGAVRSLEPVALERFFRALPGRALIGHKVFSAASSLSEIKRPAAAAELRALFASEEVLSPLVSLDLSGRARSAPGVFILVRLRPALSVDFLTDGYAPGLGVDLDLFAPRAQPSLAFTPREALNLARKAQGAGISVIDFGRPPRLRDVEFLAESSAVLKLVEGSPVLSELHAGADTGMSSTRMEAVSAMSLVSRHHLQTPIAVDPAVVEIADMSLAAPASRSGLLGYQDHFVSLYLASDKGAICALDTGLGKTVTALSAVAESAAGNPSYVALAAVPSAVRSQWVEEVKRWAPALTAVVISSRKDFEAFRVSLPRTKPVLVVVSHEFLSRNSSLVASVRFDDFLMDEVRFVSQSSGRVRAWREVREASARALALTATPAERDLSEVAMLASLVRADDTLLSGVKKGSYDPSRLGPILFKRTKAELVSTLPGIVSTFEELEPSEAEVALFEKIVSELKKRAERLRHLRQVGETGSLAAARSNLQAGIRLLRSAESDPTNLMRSSSEWSRSLVDSGLVAPAAAHAVRRQHVAQLAQSLSAAGPVLVCSDFVASCEALSEASAALGLRSAALTGNLDPLSRTMLVAAFASGDLDLLAVPVSAQRGVNLQSAASLVHLDLPLTGSLLTQRTGRVVRIGAAHTKVQVHVPYYVGTSDSIVLGALKPLIKAFDEPGDSSLLASVLTDEDSMLRFVDALT